MAVWWQQKAPETLQPPFDGRVTQKYSMSCPGIEIFGNAQDVYACYDGKVVSVEEDDGEYTVTISHTGGLTTVYGRLLTATVEKGDKVKTGTSIGAAMPDKEGYSMFLQVKLDDVIVDPVPYFQ